MLIKVNFFHIIYIQPIQDYALTKHVLLGDLYELQNIHTGHIV